MSKKREHPNTLHAVTSRFPRLSLFALVLATLASCLSEKTGKAGGRADAVMPLPDANLLGPSTVEIEYLEPDGTPIAGTVVYSNDADGVLLETKTTSSNGHVQLKLAEGGTLTFEGAYLWSLAGIEPGFIRVRRLLRFAEALGEVLFPGEAQVAGVPLGSVGGYNSPLDDGLFLVSDGCVEDSKFDLWSFVNRNWYIAHRLRSLESSGSLQRRRWSCFRRSAHLQAKGNCDVHSLESQTI